VKDADGSIFLGVGQSTTGDRLRFGNLEQLPRSADHCCRAADGSIEVSREKIHPKSFLTNAPALGIVKTIRNERAGKTWWAEHGYRLAHIGRRLINRLFRLPAADSGRVSKVLSPSSVERGLRSAIDSLLDSFRTHGGVKKMA
jgi:hypothetical protein